MNHTIAQTPGAVPAAPAAPAAHWHAHLSAIAKPVAAPPAVAKPQPPAAAAAAAEPVVCPRAVVGVSLDPRLLDVPVQLKPQSAQLYLSCANREAVDANHQDDGSGQQRWIIRPVKDAPGEYNILVSCAQDSWFLSVPAEGKAVDLWHVDDGSGRQRWVFRQVGDDLYTIRLVGGKADTRVFLGIDGNGTQVRLFEGENSKTRWSVAPLAAATPSTRAETRPPSHIPRDVVPQLTKLTGMSERQLDVVLQLISLPENGMPRWYKNYNYIEFLGDGRGFTATLFGACSGTGDLAMIVDELAKIQPRSAACDELLTYRDVLKKKKGDDIKGIEPIKKIIKGLGEDAAWQQAVWKVYVKLYWQFAMDWADKTGKCAKRPGPPLSLAVTRGFMVDTAINHGAEYDSFMDIVKRMPEAARGAKDELVWFKAFADAREKMLKSGYQDLDTSKTGDRCRLWKDLAGSNTALATPFQAYAGYWGKYTIQ